MNKILKYISLMCMCVYQRNMLKYTNIEKLYACTIILTYYTHSKPYIKQKFKKYDKGNINNVLLIYKKIHSHFKNHWYY